MDSTRMIQIGMKSCDPSIYTTQILSNAYKESI
ncbi:uncharacterized protein G2W53_025440 [Senna tora]|uniref:Uncharacterized protein n=1 Tax=Senna tora TaxID=362788 RepID=A0A834TFQ5_9FABA|nr:uncharacterized protein G2W53_025440 [Senna tora]